MAWDRAFGRNVHIFFGKNQDPSFGLVVEPERPHITKSDLYRYLDVLVLPDYPTESPDEQEPPRRCFQLKLKTITNDEETLADYPPDDILVEPETLLVLLPRDKTVPLKMNTEPFAGRYVKRKNPNILEYFTASPKAPDSFFNGAVQARHTKCVFSQKRKIQGYGDYHYCQSVQIFPSDAKELWKDLDEETRNCITNYPNKLAGASKNKGKTRHMTLEEELKTAQNGLWVLEPIKARFERFMIGVDPDADYKIIVFRHDKYRIAGKTMHQSAWHESRDGVPHPLLRWHLRMCILANMRGNGEPLVMYDEDGLRSEGILADLERATQEVYAEIRGDTREQVIMAPEREETPEDRMARIRARDKPTDEELSTMVSSQSSVPINRPNLPR